MKDTTEMWERNNKLKNLYWTKIFKKKGLIKGPCYLALLFQIGIYRHTIYLSDRGFSQKFLKIIFLSCSGFYFTIGIFTDFLWLNENNGLLQFRMLKMSKSSNQKINKECPGGPVTRTLLPLPRTQVESLVGELSVHKPWDIAKNK